MTVLGGTGVNATGRSNGKRKIHRHAKISGQFAPRLVEMLRSPAYRVLSVSAHRILARLEIELADHGGNDNGRLPVTFDDFEEFGVERHAIAPAIRECCALGFIEVTEAGRAGNAEFRTPNLFRIAYRNSENLLGDGSHEWRRIETMEGALALARAARKLIKKQKSSAEKPTGPSAGKPTESAPFPVRKTPTTPVVGKPALLSISRGGDSDAASRSAPIGSAVASEAALHGVIATALQRMPLEESAPLTDGNHGKRALTSLWEEKFRRSVAGERGDV
jgi:hypothetical protein